MTKRGWGYMNLAFVIILLMTCRSEPPRAVRRRDSVSARDSVTRVDTPRRDTTSLASGVEDPPCFASHFGLPCR